MPVKSTIQGGDKGWKEEEGEGKSSFSLPFRDAWMQTSRRNTNFNIDRVCT